MKTRRKNHFADPAYCERMCRLAVQFGWTLKPVTVADHYAYTFVAPNGTEAVGTAHTTKPDALTAACQQLAKHLC